MKKLTTLIALAGLIGTPAIAADMAVKARPPLPAPVHRWTGFYVGVNAGWNWTTASTTTQVATSLTNTSFPDSANGNGAIGGVQFGYNWQTISNWIAGIEADFQVSGANATSNSHQLRLNPGLFGAVTTESFAHTHSLDWLGTVRGRLGYAFSKDFMLYATGGLAYGQVTESTPALFMRTLITFPPNITTANTVFEASAVRTGWTAGGGIESAVPNAHVSWKLEYLYVNLASANFSFAGTILGLPVTNTTTSTLADHIVRIGLNWHLN
ncbi:MAG: outer rane immunogenic protein [Alphaproteobacteria bacterium]|jgi:outer membrane immunogenic protein|nr:outer rane immunogenic protein [Alphaproteobacteria bacterium]